MKPDKIYFGFCEATHLESYCLEKKGECQTEYLRKDALLEWAEDFKATTGWSEIEEAMDDLIDKLNSM